MPLKSWKIQIYFVSLQIDPLSFNKAITEEKWIDAMNEKIHAIEKNDAWKLTNLLETKKEIGVKWIYKMKKNAKG